MYTIDASVWVNGFDHKEPGSALSRQLLKLLADEAVPLVIPNLALVEVAGSISRTRRRPAKAQAFAHTIAHLPHVTVVPLTGELASSAWQLAAQHALRGADAVYAAIAINAGTTLVTLDGEHLSRLRSVLPTVTPSVLLSQLRNSQ